MEPRQTPSQPPAGTEDWKAGDLAECIASVEWCNTLGEPTSGPKRGEVRIVDQITACSCEQCRNVPHLRFAAYGQAAFDCRVFRKITPRADTAERGDAEWLDKFLSTPLKEAAKCDS